MHTDSKRFRSSPFFLETEFLLRLYKRPPFIRTVTHFYIFLCSGDRHLIIVLDNGQLDTHLLYFILQYVYYNTLHVSSITCS